MISEFSDVPLEKTIIMGIINLSPETFYEGSLADSAEKAVDRAEQMIENGAQIIDLGGMSTGPNVEPISAEEEKELLLPTIRTMRKRIDEPISVDTQRADVARECLSEGANIVNDVSGFKADPKMPKVAAEFDCSGILMANSIEGRVRTAEKGSRDIEDMEDIKKGLKESLQICEENGIDLSKMAIDPAIGFGRGKDWDLRVLADLKELKELEQPICLGVSRKSFIGRVLDLDDPSERLIGSLGATAWSIVDGADIIRTHDPFETSQLVRMIEAIEESGGN